MTLKSISQYCPNWSLLHRIDRLLVFILGVATANAETPSARTEVLLSQGLVGVFASEALENNPGLQAFDKRFEAAKQSIASSGVLPNPRIQLTHFIESIETRTGPQNNALSLQLPFPWLEKLGQGKAIAKAESESLWQAYAGEQFQVIDRVAELVYRIAYLDKSLELTRETIRLLRQIEPIVEQRVKTGGDLNSLLRLQVEIEGFEDLAKRHEADRVGYLSLLEAKLGRSASRGMGVFDWKPPQPLASNPKEWIAAIPRRNPRIALLTALERSHSARQRLSRLASKPDFSLGVNYIDTGGAIDPSMKDSGKDPWALVVGVSLPIWSKANNAVALQASLQKEAIAAEIEDQKLALQGQARSWIAKLGDAEQRIARYYERVLPLARQAKEITTSSYESGQASILDVIDSDRSLLKLEIEYWRASADAWLARWKLATLSGGLWLN